MTTNISELIDTYKETQRKLYSYIYPKVLKLLQERGLSTVNHNWQITWVDKNTDNKIEIFVEELLDGDIESFILTQEELEQL